MTEVKISDEGGDTMTCVELNGYIFPRFDIQAIVGLGSVRIRKEDILLLGYPKTGNHWIWEITRQILSGRVLDDDIFMTTMFMDQTREEEYVDIPSPRILTTHTQLPQLPPDVMKKQPKIINILRNPKDIAASFYPFIKNLPYMHYDGKWENFLQPFVKGKFCYGSWMDYVLAWEKVKVDYPDWPILTLMYEDAIEDPMREARKLCTFLDVERRDDFLEEVCQRCSFENMRILKSTTDRKSIVFRKGRVGDWKNRFTVAQNEWFDQLYQEKMKDCPLTFRYFLDES